MTIVYFDSTQPEEDGFYLLRVDGDLTIAELCGDEWLIIGSDYNVWEYSPEDYRIEVLRKLNLKELAQGA